MLFVLFKWLCVAGVLWGALRLFEWRSLYYPGALTPPVPSDYGLAFEEVQFMTEDGKLLHGWWMPNDRARGTVIYCHGNAGSIGERASLCADLHKLDVNVFVFDYRGYGLSKGIPTEQGTYRDARAAFEVVRAKHDDAENPPVVVYGVSLGGAVAVQLALDRPVRGVVLEGTFTSVADIGERLYPWLPVRLLGKFKYDSIAKIGRLAIPKLIAHSKDDELIPYEHGQRLFRDAAHPKDFVILQGPHGESGWLEKPAYLENIRHLLDQALGPPPL